MTQIVSEQAQEFEVGDRVVIVAGSWLGTRNLGRVIRVTPKQVLASIDGSEYEFRFWKATGYEVGVGTSGRIEHATAETQRYFEANELLAQLKERVAMMPMPNESSHSLVETEHYLIATLDLVRELRTLKERDI